VLCGIAKRLYGIEDEYIDSELHYTELIVMMVVNKIIFEFGGLENIRRFPVLTPLGLEHIKGEVINNISMLPSNMRQLLHFCTTDAATIKKETIPLPTTRSKSAPSTPEKPPKHSSPFKPPALKPPTSSVKHPQPSEIIKNAKCIEAVCTQCIHVRNVPIDKWLKNASCHGPLISNNSGYINYNCEYCGNKILLKTGEPLNQIMCKSCLKPAFLESDKRNERVICAEY